MAKVNSTGKHPKTMLGAEITPEIAEALAAEAKRTSNYCLFDSAQALL